MKPWRITIDTNPDQCNLKCIMCDTHSIYNKDKAFHRIPMNRKLVQKAIDEAIKTGVKEIIPSTMGEPLLYEHFDVFIEKLSASDTKLNLTTNGTFPKYGVEQWAKKLLPVLSDIKISVNSIDPTVNETIMVDDRTNRKIDNIKIIASLRKQNFPDVSITLQVTFLKSNLDNLEELIKFAVDHGLDRVKGHHLWITYDEIADQSLYACKETIAVWNELMERLSPYREKIQLVNFDKILIDKINVGLVEKGCCPFLDKELWIDYNGDFNICCAPSSERVKLGRWGNIETNGIEEVFNSAEYKTLTEHYKNKDVCKKCPLRRPCD